MRTRKLKSAQEYATRQNIPFSCITKRDGWFYIPNKGQKFPTSLENRKLRSFEEQGHCK